MLRLVLPSVALQNEYMDFYQDWKSSGETMVPWVIGKDPSDFVSYVQFLERHSRGEQLPEGWLPDTTYWMINESNRILGAVNIRHGLTQYLLESGGHIGFGIRPSARRNGYATKLLALALEKANELGIDKILVVCDDTNIASERTIRKLGGIEDVPFIEEDGTVVKRFWIGSY